jgi:predicted RNA-binding protein (virulence factor B family)
MRLQAGTVVSLEVARSVPPNGYFLTDGKLDVLLPYTDATGEIEPRDMVDVFLYHDSKDRFIATMKLPPVRLHEMALLEVADINPRLGYFLEMGLGRQLLLPNGELPELPELRPVKGDKVFVVVEHDKQGRLLARLAGEKDFEPKVFRAPESWKNQTTQCRVYKALQIGSFVLCEGGVLGFGALGFIHESERTGLLRIGQQVSARVTFVREDGRVNLSMKPLKEAGRDEDAERIIAYLQERPNGAMPYSDETPADIIQQKFSVSKSAFKRALGKLMKEGAVYQEGSWTYLKNQEQQER